MSATLTLGDACASALSGAVPSRKTFTAYTNPERVDPELRARAASAQDFAARCAPFKVAASLGAFPEKRPLSVAAELGRRMTPTERMVVAVLRQLQRHQGADGAEAWPGLRCTVDQWRSLTGYSERSLFRAFATLGHCPDECEHAGARECSTHARWLVRVPQYTDGVSWLPVGGGRLRQYERRQTASAYALVGRALGRVTSLLRTMGRWVARASGRATAAIARRLERRGGAAHMHRSDRADKSSPQRVSPFGVSGAASGPPPLPEPSAADWIAFDALVTAAPWQREGSGFAAQSIPGPAGPLTGAAAPPRGRAFGGESS